MISKPRLYGARLVLYRRLDEQVANWFEALRHNAVAPALPSVTKVLNPVTVNLPGMLVVSELVPRTIVLLVLTVAFAPIAVDWVKLLTVGPALSPRAVLFEPVLC